VPELIDELSARLTLPPDALDRTVDSLALVDDAVRRLDPKKRMGGDLFDSLVAYVGEVIRASTDGVWETRLASDRETSEPWVVARSGARHPPFAIVSQELDAGIDGSLRGALLGELAARRR
jgi:hypothetical protein